MLTASYAMIGGMALFEALAGRIWPRYTKQRELHQRAGINLLWIVIFIPIIILGVGWMAIATDGDAAIRQWPTLLTLFVAQLITSRFGFYIVIDLGEGRFGSTDTDLQDIISLAGILVLGVPALWVTLVSFFLLFAIEQIRSPTPDPPARIMSFCFGVGMATFFGMVSITLYQAFGGQFPIPDLTLPNLLRTLIFVVVSGGGSAIILGLFLHQLARITPQLQGQGAMGRFFIFALIIFITSPIGILLAAIYSQLGALPAAILFGLIIIAGWVSNRFSNVLDLNQIRAREMQQIEALSRDLLAAPPDNSNLSSLLAKHVPTMFRMDVLSMRLTDGTLLLHTPAERPAIPAEIWQWHSENPIPQVVPLNRPLPWQPNQKATYPIAVVPIFTADGAKFVGSIYVQFIRFGAASMGPETAIPALQSLAAQISAALQRAETWQASLAAERTRRELEIAGRIQASFLPTDLPPHPGWEITTALHPARETSGDFYDVFALPNDQLALVVADVADKGTPAALYMMLTRTLLRTYATENPTDPAAVLAATNRRILEDANTDQFVTVFYAILNPHTGQITYANAGHNPAFLFAPATETPIAQLGNTGMVLGIFDDANWQTATINIQAGQALVIYSDGLTDAHNPATEAYGTQRLQRAVARARPFTAAQIETQLTHDVFKFIDTADLFDDLTLVVVQRQN